MAFYRVEVRSSDPEYLNPRFADSEGWVGMFRWSNFGDSISWPSAPVCLLRISNTHQDHHPYSPTQRFWFTESFWRAHESDFVQTIDWFHSIGLRVRVLKVEHPIDHQPLDDDQCLMPAEVCEDAEIVDSRA